MASQTKELREKRHVIGLSMHEFNDKIYSEDRKFTGDEQAKWEQMNGDYNALTDKIERAEKLDAVDLNSQAHQQVQLGRDDRDTSKDQDQDPSVPTQRHRSLALQAWAASGKINITEEHREACKLTGISPGSDIEFKLPTNERLDPMQLAYRSGPRGSAHQRALSAVVGSTGGSTVPEGFVDAWEIALLDFSGVRQVAQVLRTDLGNDLPWPTTDDTSNEGELLGENAAVSEQDITVGQIIFKAYKFSSKMIKVPIELLEDSAFDIASSLGRMLGERIGRITNRKTTTGTGAAEPTGIVVAAAAGITAASATAIAADELFDLQDSIDPAYETGPGVGFMLHKKILTEIRKLKDGNGQYLFVNGLQSGVADNLLGNPIFRNQNMASAITTGVRTVLYGQLSKYFVREVRSIRLRRLVERFADNDQEAFLAMMRLDGNLLDAGTGPVKALTQA